MISTSNNLIPKPTSMIITNDDGDASFFTLGETAVITVHVLATSANHCVYVNHDVQAATVQKIGHYLADKLKPATGFEFPVVVASATNLPVHELEASVDQKNAINLILIIDDDDDDGDEDTESSSSSCYGKEGYKLVVTSNAVCLWAAQPAGLFRGVQTLRQLLPSQVESTTVVQNAEWTIPSGWIIQDAPRFAHRGAMLDPARHFIPVANVKRFMDDMAYFKLNVLHLHLTDDQGWRIEIKSWPRLTETGGSTAVGGGSAGAGYYTQEDYQDLVAYAQERYITIIPEIDMPGHTNAALASYAELNCDNTTTSLYTGKEVGFSSLCIDKDITYQFIDDVIREVAAITPGPYIHVGGDEAKQTKDDDDDFVRFMDRVLPIVQKHGKKVIAWDEASKANINGTANAVIQYWNSERNVQLALDKGARLIMSPSSKAYLDMKYYPEGDDSQRLGLQWAGFVNTETAYRWDPTTIVPPGTPEDCILGIEAPLWGETTETVADLQWLAYPRLIGHAEIGWSSQESGRDWEGYKHRLSAMEPRLDLMGINYYHDPVIP